jgi:hypothetical protein
MWVIRKMGRGAGINRELLNTYRVNAKLETS